MKVIKYENEFGLIISFQELDKQLDISFGGNGDLYWTIHSKNENDNHDFIITKENYGIYRLFEELFDDIENIKIFEEDIPFYLETEEGKQEYINKLYGQSYINKIVNKEIEEYELTDIINDARTIAYPNEDDIKKTYSYIFVLSKRN